MPGGAGRALIVYVTTGPPFGAATASLPASRANRSAAGRGGARPRAAGRLTPTRCTAKSSDSKALHQLPNFLPCPPPQLPVAAGNEAAPLLPPG